MYNGIGLTTARGSGTNGFVTKNMSLIRHHKDKVDYKSEKEMAKLDASMNKPPNQEILNHERKRKMELKCVEMQELMEEQGYSEEEIEQKVSVFRQMLLDNEGILDQTIEKDELGRPIAKETHALAEANRAKNEQLKVALGLSAHYIDGSSLDPNRKQKEEVARALAMAKQNYAIVKEPDSPSPERKTKKTKEESKKHHKKERKRKNKKSKKKSSKKRQDETSDSSSSSESSSSESDSEEEIDEPDDIRDRSRKHANKSARDQSRSLSYSPIRKKQNDTVVSHSERERHRGRRHEAKSESRSASPQSRHREQKRHTRDRHGKHRQERLSSGESRSPPHLTGHKHSTDARKRSPARHDRRQRSKSSSEEHHDSRKPRHSRRSRSRSRSPVHSRSRRSISPRRRKVDQRSRSRSPHRRHRSRSGDRY